MTPPFRRVLVANRGEIAIRIIRACHEVGAEAVAVYSDPDAGARHVRAADTAVRIGPAPAAESYLSIDALLRAAKESGAEAVHPGYGFLSERAAFASACEAAGLAFVGPESRTLAGMGDKVAARRAATAVGVPVVPGTLDPSDASDPKVRRALAAEAETIGWPLMVKASAGGGGRGMRLVADPADLDDALAAAGREALAAFGDGAVFLERYVAPARHVEVQLLGDCDGGIVALGERDCSLQRRHQKLVEEAPAPGLTAEQRREVHGLAVTIARSFGLRNAATAEFLLGPDGRFWFLEVNTRLQVEHGVTELVTGVDIVREQLWIAAGRPLSDRVWDAAARATSPESHAIEVRISAEDPGRQFVPVPGTITRWREPGGPGVRVDGWVEEGTVVGADYDPLLAKVLVVDATRDEALVRLRRALDELEVGGLQTTLPFHRWIAAHPDFAAMRVSTTYVDERWDPGPGRAEAAARAAALVAATRDGASPSTRQDRDVPAGEGSRQAAGRPAGAAGDPETPAWVAAGRRDGTTGWWP